MIPDLYDQAHDAVRKQHNLLDLGQVSSVGSVLLYRSCTRSHNGRLDNLYDLNRGLSDLSDLDRDLSDLSYCRCETFWSRLCTYDMRCISWPHAFAQNSISSSPCNACRACPKRTELHKIRAGSSLPPEICQASNVLAVFWR